MKIEGPLIPATFVERPNRFITLVSIDGDIHRSHLPDPGRLKELLVSGADLLVRQAPKNSNRKTKYTTVMVNHEGQLISLVSSLPNQFVGLALKNNELPMLNGYTLIRPEIPVGSHRFDFLLKSPIGSDFYAVTERGKNHAKALKKLVQNGYEAGILFVCQRPDASSFRPMWERDPKLAEAVLDARNAGVNIRCITLNVSKTEITFKQEIPVNLEIAEN